MTSMCDRWYTRGGLYDFDITIEAVENEKKPRKY